MIEHVLGSAAEQEFASARVTICPHDQEIRRVLLDKGVD